jgi:hypothetical protein
LSQLLYVHAVFNATNFGIFECSKQSPKSKVSRLRLSPASQQNAVHSRDGNFSTNMSLILLGGTHPTYNLMQSTALSLLLLFTFLEFSTLGYGLGINCDGCITDSGDRDTATRLTQYISGINQSHWYEDWKSIACITLNYTRGGGSVCAYLQNTGGALGSKISELAHYIPDHGCAVCGSVPFAYPSGNDVSSGELTFGVSHPCSNPDGLCNSSIAGGAGICMYSFVCTLLISNGALPSPYVNPLVYPRPAHHPRCCHITPYSQYFDMLRMYL